MTQTFEDYEIVLTNEPGMSHNHNAAIFKSRGELIKVLQMDDYFIDSHALGKIVEHFDTKDAKWLISASTHPDGYIHQPYWTDDIYKGNNRLGSLSTITFRKEAQLLFEEPLTWLVDCDWYYRMYLKYGPPILSNDVAVMIDTREDRLTHTISNEVKEAEIKYLIQKYDKRTV